MEGQPQFIFENPDQRKLFETEIREGYGDSSLTDGQQISRTPFDDLRDEVEGDA